jgi:L-iditol 2-dehydrogenase
MQIGDTVSVVGVGVTGLIHVQLAKLFGAGMVIATDFSAFRLEKAHMFGADFTFDAHEDTSTKIREVNKGRGTDIVIITAGNIKAIEQGLDLAGEGATVLLFAPTPPEVLLSINPYRFFFSEISIVASYSCSPLETRQALKLIQRRYIEVDKLITHHFDLARVGKAIRLATEAKESLKIIITP